MIRVLVVDDSPVFKTLMMKCLSADPLLEVAGIASNGKEAIMLNEKLNPDVITMDVNMPVLNGLDATKIIMEKKPVPIIIVSSEFDPKNVNDTFKALEAGAVAVAEKPHSFGSEAFEISSAKLRQTIRLMSEIKVVRRSAASGLNLEGFSPITRAVPAQDEKDYQIVAIGASTGGPVVIEKVLASIKESFYIPIVIVQHIVPAFAQGFVDWLRSTTRYTVKFAEDHEVPRPRHCYIAPPDKHLVFSRDGNFAFSSGEAVNNSVPSVSVFFNSVASVYGRKAIGILLSGMGKDGAAELKEIKDAGGLTIAQNKASCVVYGMPAEAVNIGAASLILAPDDISNYLNLIKLRGKG
ncbi:MAG: chemotaxis-specific protein-glutamate methyltransferase CheB [Ignavibacteriaceae bacterium]|nr:chemotaxis-specific protein-glutamate methyltransferase CheB [Ignavibacteriaceae bacterium]